MKSSHLLFCSAILAACGQQSGDAQPASGEVSAVIQAWSEGHDALDEFVMGLSAPDRWLAVRSLLEKHPESSTGPVCRVLTGQAYRACVKQKTQIENRPHLWADSPNVQGQEKRKALDEKKRRHSRRSRLDLPVGLTSSLLELKPRAVDCRDGDSECRIRAAVSVLKTEGIREAAASCVQDSERWQAECFFRLGEEQATLGRVDQSKGSLADTVEVCLASGNFAAECLEHSLIQYSHVAPAADDPRGEMWEGLKRHAQKLREGWGTRDSTLLQVLLERYWSSIFEQAFMRSQHITGDLLEHFSSRYSPQIRAAAAYHWVERQKANGTDWGEGESALEAWAAQFMKALSVRSQGTSAVRAGSPLRVRDYWSVDHAGDEAFAAIAYLGVSRRTWSEDTQVDAKIALLEAFAQHSVARPVLRAARSSSTKEIAWTADRLVDRMGD